ncbi:MAG: PH domain-containing protein [bacterium]|nr:PH domain-containing protein [bacterium]
MINLEEISHQKEYEKFILTLRRHWIILFGHFCMLFLEIALPLVLMLLWNPSIADLANHPIIGPAFLLLASSYSLLIILLFFHNFVDYYLDTWIVTNERLINIEQKGFFFRTIAELRYYRVQDVASEVKGILPTLFHYGDVTVQTAGTQPRFTMKQVPNAHDIARRIHILLEEDKKYHDEKKKEEGIT